MADRILVPFEGDGSGVEDLSWGQHHIWLEMDASQSSLNMCATRELAPGTTVEEIADELRFYMSGYETMRTRLVFHDGRPPRQRVYGCGEVPLELVDAGDAEAAGVAEALHTRYRDTAFDYVDEWPVRMGVVMRHGSPTHMVMTLCHIVSDAAGALVMFLDHADRDPATGLTRRPPAVHPRELARRQRSPAERRHSDSALRYWERAVRSIPARRFPEPADPPPHRYWQAWFVSPAMALALRGAATRLGSDPSTILLAAFSAALVRVTGSDPAVMRLVVSNRFRPGLAEVVGPVSQFGLCVVEVGGSSFAEVVRRARLRALNANKHAYYDMAGLAELLDRVAADRGEPIDLSVYYNDRRPPEPSDAEGAAAPVVPEAVRAARAGTTVGFERQHRSSGPHLMLHVDQSDRAVVIFAEVDAHHLRLDDLEAILRAMEAVVVEAAGGDEPIHSGP